MKLDARADIMRQCHLCPVTFFQQAQQALDALGIAWLLRKATIKIGFRTKCVEREYRPPFGDTRVPLRLDQLVAMTDGDSGQVRALLFQDIQDAQVFVSPYQGMNIDAGSCLALHASRGPQLAFLEWIDGRTGS